MSVAIDNSERLCKILAELEQYAKILMEDRMSIVSVVGNMRWQYAGVEAQIIEALADIPLRMISYGSNDSDVAFVIKTEDKKRALQALSNKLFEPETDKVTDDTFLYITERLYQNGYSPIPHSNIASTWKQLTCFYEKALYHSIHMRPLW